MRICVFGAASSLIDEKYITKVEELGRQIAARGHSLVFGAGGSGLMGAAARGVHEGGGKIFGVIPKFFAEEKVESIYDKCDEIVMPETMRQRKQIMEDNTDAFIIVPGGIGTFEEFFEVLTLKQLRRHNKPLVIYNIFNYYSSVIQTIDYAIETDFVKSKCLDLYTVTDDLEELFAVVEGPATAVGTVNEFKHG